MTDFNLIGIGVNPNTYLIPEKKEEVKKPDIEKTNNQPTIKQLSSSDTLSIMAAQSADVVPVNTKRTVNVSEHVSPESKSRISDSMKDYENKYDNTVKDVLEEFPDMSEAAAGEVALSYLNTLI